MLALLVNGVAPEPAWPCDDSIGNSTVVAFGSGQRDQAGAYAERTRGVLVAAPVLENYTLR